MTLTSIWFVVRAVRRAGLTLQECEFEEIAPLDVRAVGSHPFNFSMNAHDELFIFHRAEYIVYRAIESSGYADSGNIIDSDNATTSSQEKAIPNPIETVIDFLSSAPASPTIRFNLIGGSHVVEYAVSDTLTFPAFTTLGVFSTGNGQEVSVPSATFRYLKVRISPTALVVSANGIAIDSNDNILVASGNNIIIFDPINDRTVKVLGKDDGTSGTSNGEFNDVRGITIDSTGRMMVVDNGNDRIQIFDSNYDYLTQFGSSGTGDGQFGNIRDVAVDSSDNIYVVDNGNDRIQKFNSSGVFQAKVGSSGTGDGQFGSAIGITIDSTDNVYVVDSNNDNIQKFTSTLVFSQRLELSSTNPVDVTIDSSDNIRLLDSLNNQIKTYNTSLVFQSDTALDAANTSPVRLSVDASDNVYVTDTNNRSYKYNSSLVFQNTEGESGSIWLKQTSIDEIFDTSLGEGRVASMTLQMKDPVYDNWVSIPGLTTLQVTAKATPLSTPTDLDPPNKTNAVPFCAADQIRLVLDVVEGPSKDRIVVVKAGKQA